MNYTKIGDKERVLLLVHGFLSDHTIWDSVVGDLSQKYTLILPDLNGYGTSRKPEKYESIEDMAFSIRDILDREHIEQCIFAGHSMGGYVGLEFLNHFPERLSQFVLINSHCYTDSEERMTNREKSIAFIEKVGTKPYIKTAYKPLFYKPFSDAHPEIISDLVQKSNQLSTETVVYSLRAMIDRRNHAETLANANVPIYFILGNSDELIPLDGTNFFEGMLKLNPHSHCQIIPDCGHMSMLEKPLEVANCLINRL